MLQYTPESEKIGILDFYESLCAVPKVLAAIAETTRQMNEVHRPDNGFMSSCLELATVKFLISDLKTMQGEQDGSLQRADGIRLIEDDDLVGSSDKMIFYTKELKLGQQDEGAAHNPFVVGKLDMKNLEAFNFDRFANYIGPTDPRGGEDQAARIARVNKKNFGRFFPKLHERANLLTLPSLLVLNCNTVELLRLRQVLVMTLEQVFQLE